MSDDGKEEKKVVEKEEDFGEEEKEVPSPLDNDRSCRDILCLLIFLVRDTPHIMTWFLAAEVDISCVTAVLGTVDNPGGNGVHGRVPGQLQRPQETCFWF